LSTLNKQQSYNNVIALILLYLGEPFRRLPDLSLGVADGQASVEYIRQI
jgi:hypothetical protein